MRALSRGITALAAIALLSACERENPGPPDSGPRPDAQVQVDAGPSDASVADSGPRPDAACLSERNCWSCPPTTSLELTNACTDATCEPFPVTTDRLPLLRADGTVPPLP